MRMAYKVFGSFMIVISVILCIFYYQSFIRLSEKNNLNIEANSEQSKQDFLKYVENIREIMEKEALVFTMPKFDLPGMEKLARENNVEYISDLLNQKKRELYKEPDTREEIRIFLYSENGEIVYYDDSGFKEEHKNLIDANFSYIKDKNYSSGFVKSGDEFFITSSAKIMIDKKKICHVVLVLPVNANFLEKAGEALNVNVGTKTKNGVWTNIKNANNEDVIIEESFAKDKSEKSIDGKRYFITLIQLNENNGDGYHTLYLFKNISDIAAKKKSQTKELLLLAITLFVISGLAVFFLINIIFSKLKSVSGFLEKIISKDYNFKISQEIIKQKDEVGLLYGNIQKIKEDVQSNDEKIRYYSKELEISYKEMKNYTYIVEVKNKELVERLKEQELVKEILNRGIKELSEINRFLKFLLKKIYEYKKYKRAELIYKNSIDNAYERVSYIPEKDKFIDNFYEENLKYLINERPVTKDDYMEIPIKRDKDIIGNLKIEGIELSGTTEKTIEIIANELEIILENAELYYKMDKKIIELSFLNSISVALSSITDVNELKNMINDSIGVLFGLANYDLYVYEKGYFLDFKEVNGDIVKIKQKKVEDESLYILNKFGNIKVKKEYYIPLVIKEKLIGAIRVDAIENFKAVDKNIIRIFLTQLSIILQNNLMYFENRKRSFDIIKSLSQAIEEKDTYTKGHSHRVMTYSIKLAEKLKFTNDEIEQIRYAGILHDIGKIGISENILLKNGKLTDEEYEIIKQHPEKGYKIMSHISSLHEISKIVKYHHERPDGKGYPEGLKGEEIPKAAKIMALADTFDAMTSDRPYRKGLGLDIAKAEIQKYKGLQFDEEIADVFLEMLENGEMKIEK